MKLSAGITRVYYEKNNIFLIVYDTKLIRRNVS